MLVPLDKQPALLAAYLTDPKVRAPILVSIGLSVASSVAAGYAVSRLTPEEDTATRAGRAAATGLGLAFVSILFLANRAEMIRQSRGGAATWLEQK